MYMFAVYTNFPLVCSTLHLFMYKNYAHGLGCKVQRSFHSSIPFQYSSPAIIDSHMVITNKCHLRTCNLLEARPREAWPQALY